MCGRYALYADKDLMKAVFELSEVPDYKASYNVAPTQNILAVTADGSGRRANLYRWGLIPFWAKEIGKYSTINARAETVASKPVYRTPFKQRRCLIPANGYYEWQARPGKPKQPYYIYPLDGHLMAFAALWDHWKAPEGNTVHSATIIVTGANNDTQAIHDRMPVILPPDTWNAWLDPANHDTKALQALLKPAPIGALAARPVSTLVNSPKNNDARLIEPLNRTGNTGGSRT